MEAIVTDKTFDEEISRLEKMLSDFDVMEQSILAGSIGFGNPHSRLTALEQFLLWKEMTKQKGQFPDRDEFCNIMATY